MWTRMSRFTCITEAIVLVGLSSGCTATGRNWWGGSRQTSQAAALPMPPAAQGYQGYANAAAQPQFQQQYAGTGGGCSSGSCCSGGSCGTNRAAAVAVTPTAYGNTMANSQLANPNTKSTSVAAYGGQKTCPVTDEPLGSMGDAIPVTVKGQTIYVCCAGCVESVQSDPAPYLAKVMRERSGQ